MNVHLTPELEKLIQNKVKSGRYNSASEVIRVALRLYEERERVRELAIFQINDLDASLKARSTAKTAGRELVSNLRPRLRAASLQPCRQI
jgi:antitoxin ParD1/3/4